MEIKKLNNWVKEAQWAASEWRAESWRDSEMVDGGDAQWTTDDKSAAEDAGIDIITINRSFPTVNYIIGYEVLNKFDILAKGRTKNDTETSQVMSEGLKFVMDQNSGEFLISDAFKDQIVPGIGCLSPCLNTDPRKEILAVKYRDWKEIWWDPFGSVWWKPNSCRYWFTQRWMDLEDLKGMFWEKRNEIQNKYDELSGASVEDYGGYPFDEAQLVEEEKMLLSSIDWANGERKRVRPCEMWYPEYTKATFAVFADGNAKELKDTIPILEQYEIITAATQVVASVVQKMKVTTFLEDLELHDSASPYPHDQYPHIPFVGYIDRWGFPYGVPRQIRGQDEEINKRRSMAKALLNSRRIIAEKSAAADLSERQAQYEEAQKLSGYIVVEDGTLGKGGFQLVDEAQLSVSQLALMQQDEQEIREVTGQLTAGVIAKSNPVSGRAIDKAEASSSLPATAKLFQNLRRSLKLLGEQTISNMQGYWQTEKVLRITDSFSGSERFETLNQKVIDEDGRVIEVRNDITQGMYDLIVTETPQTDTIREKNLDLLIAWAQKSPPEAIKPLVMAAFELSNIPNKEKLMAKLGPALGADPTEADLSPAQLKQKVIQELEAQQAEQAEIREIQKADAKLELLEKEAKIYEVEAKIERLKAEAVKKLADVELTERRVSNETNKVEIERAEAMTEAAKVAHEITMPVTKTGNA